MLHEFDGLYADLKQALRLWSSAAVLDKLAAGLSVQAERATLHYQKLEKSTTSKERKGLTN